MRRIVLAAVGAVGIGMCLLGPPARAADHPVVGLVAAFSGPYAEWGEDYKREIDLYMAEHDGKDGNPKINLILRDTPGTDYARTKQVVQEFITRDGAAVVGGGEFTPEALAVAPLVTEAKIPYVIFNGATSFIVDKSPYLVLAGFTIWQPNVPLAEYAAAHGCKRATLVIADYAPGKDTVDALTYGFQKAGGGSKVVEVIKVPLGTTDFSAYMQRLADSKPNCVIPFMPGGPMSLTFAKDFASRGFANQGVVLYDAGGITAENQLDAVGDAAIGLISTSNYSTYLNNPMNQAFIGALQKKYPHIKRDFVTTDGYVGMAIIYKMLRATNGVRDGDKAMAAIKGYSWMSPRGPVSIDPKTRDIVQNIYVRKCVKENGVTYNKEFQTFPAVHDQWHELHPPSG
jgi:branched-chain amino acid transport system substrate-binding protein